MARLAVASVIGLTLIAAVLGFAEHLNQRRYGFDATALISSSLRISILTVATYLGVIGQVLATRLKRSPKRRVSILKELGKACSTGEFWLAIIASPIVLFAAYNAVASATSLVLVGALGFQNGYFFHSILARQESTSDE